MQVKLVKYLSGKSLKKGKMIRERKVNGLWISCRIKGSKINKSRTEDIGYK